MQEPSSSLGVVVTSAALASIVSVGFAGAVYGPTISAIASIQGTDVARAGLMISAHGAGAFAGVAICLYPGVEERMRFRSAFALLLIAIGATLVATKLQLPFPFIGALAIGIGYGLLTVGLNGLFARSFGQYSGAMVNLLNTMFGIGAVAAPFVFVKSGGSVPTTYFLLAGFALCLILPALRLDDRKSSLPIHHGTGGSIKMTRKQFLILAIMFLAIGTEVCIVGWGPTILTAHGIDPLIAAGAGSWFFVVYLAARSSAVMLSLYFRFQTLLLTTMILLAVISANAWHAENPYGWFVAMGIVGVVFPNTFGWFAGFMRDVAGGEARIILAALFGATLMPLGMGPLANSIGVETMFAPMALLWILTLSLSLLFAYQR